LQGDSVGVATALSPATVGHFKFLFHQLFVGLGLSDACRRAAKLKGAKVFAGGLQPVR
jgi:hypothetical protein